jgi:hypothetical protein
LHSRRERRLYRAAEAREILGAHHVQRAAQMRSANRLSRCEERSEVIALETLHTRPQPDVRRPRQLRLHGDEALDRA